MRKIRTKTLLSVAAFLLLICPISVFAVTSGQDVTSTWLTQNATQYFFHLQLAGVPSASDYAGADAISFAPLVDHILFVVEADRTPMPDVKKALALLPQEKLLGLVLNRLSGPDAPKYYY